MQLGFYKQLLLLCVCAFFLPSINASQTKPEHALIALNEIPGLLEKRDAQLPYNKVLASLNMKIETNLEYSYYPASRTSFVFNKKRSLCMFPASLTSNLDNKDALIETIPLNVAQAFFLSTTAVNTKDIVAKDAKKLVIGFRRGNTFGGMIERLYHHTLYPLDSDAQSARMLYKGRLDIVLVYMPDSLAILNLNPEEPLTYNKESLFYTQADSFLCHKTAEGIALVAAFNQEIQNMKSSGELKHLLGDAYIK